MTRAKQHDKQFKVNAVNTLRSIPICPGSNVLRTLVSESAPSPGGSSNSEIPAETCPTGDLATTLLMNRRRSLTLNANYVMPMMHLMS